MLKEYINKINQATNGNPIFYICPNPERTIGIEDLLKNYYIITANDTYPSISRQLIERGIKVFLTPHTTSSLKIIKEVEVRDYIKASSHKRANVMFFRNSPAIEKATSEFNLLNANAKIANAIENKIAQYIMLKNSPLADNIPKAIIKRITDIEYKDIINELGESFVIQFDIGHSGNSTFFIRSESDFDSFKEKYIETNMIIKIVEMLEPIFFTINGVIAKNAVYTGGLCNQITGLKEINALSGETCGNNWNQIELENDQRNDIVDLTVKLGNHLRTLGFLGFFGVDFCISNGKIYIIEINSRQVASIPTFNKLQLFDDQIPLGVINLMVFLNIAIDIDENEYNKRNNLPKDASTLILRNHNAQDIIINKSFNGMYNIEDVKYEEDSYSITDIYSKSKIIILENDENSVIHENQEYMKILALGDVLENKFTLDKNILKVVNTVIENTKSL